MRWRGPARRTLLGLMTVTGLAPRGWFVPYRLAGAVPPEAADAEYPAAEALFASRARHFEDFAEDMAAYLPALCEAATGVPPAPRLDQDWFPPLDALAAYTMVRKIRPRRILEIGGGHSTRFFVQAARDGAPGAAITVVDPEPARALRGLADGGAVHLHAGLLQAVDPAELPRLEPGDLLSLDGSHILMPGTDVDWVLNRILPVIAPGVVVHVHDIFLPDAYPAAWRWRGYNEQQAVAALLTGGRMEVLFAARYVVTRLPEAAAAAGLDRLPASRAPASGLWLRHAGAPGTGSQ